VRRILAARARAGNAGDRGVFWSLADDVLKA
jgi:hypothetical protein